MQQSDHPGLPFDERADRRALVLADDVGVGPGRGAEIALGPSPPARPPHRTCGFHRIRRSPDGNCLDRNQGFCVAGPRCGDVARPPPVSGNRHCGGVEHDEPIIRAERRARDTAAGPLSIAPKDGCTTVACLPLLSLLCTSSQRAPRPEKSGLRGQISHSRPWPGSRGPARSAWSGGKGGSPDGLCRPFDPVRSRALACSRRRPTRLILRGAARGATVPHTRLARMVFGQLDSAHGGDE